MIAGPLFPRSIAFLQIETLSTETYYIYADQIRNLQKKCNTYFTACF